MAKKQLIIMDEVDGMAGGDRGGVAQMIAFIKKTQVSFSISTELSPNIYEGICEP